MKKTTLTALIALMGAGAFTSAKAQSAASNVAVTDYVLGVTDTADGFNKDVLINLGNFANIGSAIGSNGININADLTQIFGANYGSLGIDSNGLSYGVIALANGDLYMSQQTTADDGYPSTDGSAGQNALNEETTYGPALASFGNLVVEIKGAASGTLANSTNTPDGVAVASSDPNSWYNLQLSGFGISAYGSSLDATIGTALDLYQYVPAPSFNNGSYLGYQINLSTNGVLTTTAVPEPSAYVLFGLGALVLMIAYRRHRNA